ncbi:type II toxin-antitoxin system RelE/ParE family toxin [Reichenbachiella ulvae]|uniref:Type II toxin-antitoxin system RelE/ParE family toxin n=1 Tax=Reichenbachiella ulvae TaxID=2980104 RepID=A0ABT3CY11_9BACT|nr:type II toxin-antitoxin system RelE/ParE family toxin [Reichenbachiella ulvae]MCV9388586.1 type II toxin-antitoxin system RelE/ParE family toxin [Reichenbachiella ulvae]
MKLKIELTAKFKRKAKSILKKHPSFKSDLSSLISQLKENPRQGTPLKNNCYKIRLSITSKGKGKSGGARVITHLHITATTIYLIYIYDKSEQENISDKEILELIKGL